MSENAIVSVDNTNAIAPIVDFESPEGFICTIDTSTDEGAINAANALGSAESLSNYGTDEFVVKDIITKPGVRAITSESCTDVILVLADGTCLFSQSVGILNSVVMLIASLGLDKLHRGVRVKLTEIKTRGGNTLKQLRVLGFAS